MATPARRSGRPVGSDGVVTRARLLRAAREAFSDEGYEKTTTTAVAERAGLTRTAFYNYFDSKAELYRAVIDDMQAGVLDELFGSGAAGIADPVERIERVFRRSAELNAEDPSYGRFLSTMLVDGFRDPQFTDLAKGGVERTQSFFAAAIADAGVPAGSDADALADVFVSFQWGLGLFAAFMGDQERLDRVVDELKRLIDRAVT